MDFLRIEYNKAWRERVIFDKLRLGLYNIAVIPTQELD